jgi:hypothetical protein
LEVQFIKLCKNMVLVCKENEKQEKCELLGHVGELRLAFVKQRMLCFFCEVEED